jgi:peptidyl-prolyl cis-trans isomerase D
MVIDLEKPRKTLFLHLLKRVNKMSVIQTIRQKYLGLMIGSIVVALLGFLLMDALQNNGSNLFGSNDRSLGSINGTTVSNEEYLGLEQKYMENARSKNAKMTEQEGEEVKAQVWDDLVNQKLLEGEYEKLGIQVSDKELQGMLTSQYADPMIQQNFRDPATGVFDASKVKQYLDNLRTTKDTAQRKQWLEFEKGLIKQRLAQKYTGMVALGTYMPKGVIDAKFAERNSLAATEYVKIPYTTIDDSKVIVTDADITAFMQKYKGSFTLTDAIRKSDYVSFDVIPTSIDTENSLGVLNKNAAEFAATTTMEEFIGKNSDEGFTKDYFAKGRAKTAMTDSMGNNAVGAVAGPYFEEGAFKLFKVLDKKSLPDSARVTHLLIAITKEMSEDAAKVKIDSLEKVVIAGGDLAQLASQFSDDNGTKAKGGDLGYFAQGMMMPEFSEPCFFGNKGDLKKVKTNYGWHLLRVTDQKDFKPCAKVAVFSKSLKASEGTMNAVYTKASQFAEGIKDKATFDAAVKKNNTTKRIAEGIIANQNTIQGMGSAREIVRWAYDKQTKVGSVSGIKTVKDGLIDKYVVACLSEIANPGLAPVSMVRDRLQGEIKKQKKGAILAAQYKSAASLADIASKSGQTVATADTVLLAGSMNPVLGNEAKVVGACFNKVNSTKVSDGIYGNDGVFFIKVKSVTPSTIKASEADYQRERMMNQMQSAQNIGRSIPVIHHK